MTRAEYADHLQTSGWRWKSFQAKDRAGFRCALCNSPSRVETHHRSYANIPNERPDDLIVLCFNCHRRHHGTLDAVRQRQHEDPRQPGLPFEPLIVYDDAA
jgi:5-methylcytosine-specific restriction endonuclease McrA